MRKLSVFVCMITMFSQGVILLSQEILEIDGKNVKLTNKFNLSKIEKDKDKLKNLTNSEYKKYFNTLSPRKGVQFFLSGSTLIAKENDNYFTISESGRSDRNAESIGYFFKPIDSKQKAKDVIFYLLRSKGRIVQSREFFVKYIEEIEKINPELIVDKKINFSPFTSELINADNYKVTATLMRGFEISVKVFVVNINGYITSIDNKLCVSNLPDTDSVSPLSIPKEVVQLTNLRDKVYKQIMNSGNKVFYESIPDQKETNKNGLILK